MKKIQKSTGSKMQYPEKHTMLTEKQSLIVIVGPTAVGKTELSIQLARRLNGEVVSADSRLFYRGMDIGTAKPTREQLAAVPHHLIDVAYPDEIWSLALFQRAAQAAIADINQRNRMPFLVGGTGQYIRAVLDGWQLPSQKPDFRLRDALQKWGEEIGPVELYRRLLIIDPDAEKFIESGNLRRTIRALEVIFCTGQTFSGQRKKRPPIYQVKTIGVTRPRQEIYHRIDERVEKMLEEGFVDEVRCLIEKGYSPEMSALSAIGYREIALYLLNKISLDEAVMLIKRYTRQYVRRQANWFKESDEKICWFNPTISSIDEIVDYLYSEQGWI